MRSDKRGFSVLRSGDGPATDERAALRKRRAAERALGFVRSDTTVGLGTGSTAKVFVERLSKALNDGSLKDVVGVPTSDETEELCRRLGVETSSWLGNEPVDVAVDGADEVAPNLDLIKGLGGALLREKAVARRARRFVVVVEEAKLVKKLGTRAPLPIEVLSSAWEAEAKFLQGFGGAATLREIDGRPFVTDNGNYVVDVRFAGGIDDPQGMAKRLELRPHVKAHGLFLGMAHLVVVAGEADVRVVAR